MSESDPFEYVRKFYGVPARLNMHVKIGEEIGIIKGATHTLHVLCVGMPVIKYFHPTEHVIYYNDDGAVAMDCDKVEAGAINEINPENPLVASVHTQWHKIAAILIYKAEREQHKGEIIITMDDLMAYEVDHPDCAVLMREDVHGFHLMLISMEQGRILAEKDRKERGNN